MPTFNSVRYLNLVTSYSLLYELLYTCCCAGFGECTIRGDLEYRTFDKMKYYFEGEHSYVLVRTNNLPSNLPDVYIEGNNTCTVHDDDDSQHHGDSSSEEDHSRRVRDEDDDDDEEDDSDEDDEDDDDDDDDDDDKHDHDSEEHKEHHRLEELKIRVYNHTVEFKKNLRLVVSIKGIFNNILHPSHFLVVPFLADTIFCSWYNIIIFLPAHKHL